MAEEAVCAHESLGSPLELDLLVLVEVLVVAEVGSQASPASAKSLLT
jgi:hypothetical protein